jgi:hypothetical protein
MNCFYHPTVVAIGICKSCGKGLCPECAVDLGKGLACKGHCEDDTRAVIGLITHNIQRSPYYAKVSETARFNRYLGVAFYLTFGLLFLAFATFQYYQSGFEPPDYLLWGMGLCFVIFGLVCLERALRFPKAPK